MLLRVADLAGTHAVAAGIATLARAGDMIVLAGEMGTGKTSFAQGFGRALGVTEPITSPTFTLVHSYPVSNRLTLHHADLYRLDRTGDVEDLALHELASFHGIVLVEWGDIAAAALGDHLEVRLGFLDEHDVDADADAATDANAANDADDANAADAANAADDATSDEPTDDFADPGTREIAVRAIGPAWAGRWNRLTRALEPYRC